MPCRAMGGDKDLGLVHLAGLWINHLRRNAGVIDEHLLASHMALAHGHIELTLPGEVQGTKLALAITVGMVGPIFLPQ